MPTGVSIQQLDNGPSYRSAVRMTLTSADFTAMGAGLNLLPAPVSPFTCYAIDVLSFNMRIINGLRYTWTVSSTLNVYINASSSNWLAFISITDLSAAGTTSVQAYVPTTAPGSATFNQIAQPLVIQNANAAVPLAGNANYRLSFILYTIDLS